MSNALSTKGTGMLTPTNMSEAMQFSEMLAGSAMVPKNFQGKAADIMVAVQWGSEVGLAPMAALHNIAVINGKPSIYGDAALALVTGHPQYAGHKEWIEGHEAFCQIFRMVHGEKIETTRSFSMDDAKRAGLANKPGPWKQYPKRMLAMRARGFAIRDAFPDALKGVITIEEAQDVPKEEGMVDITPANPLDEQFGAIEEKSTPSDEPTEALEVIDDTTVVEEPEASEEEAEAVTEDDEHDQWILTLGTEITEYSIVDDWLKALNTGIQGAINNKDLSLEDRRHNASIIKKTNETQLDRLRRQFPALGKDFDARYAKLIKMLSAKIKDAAA